MSHHLRLTALRYCKRQERWHLWQTLTKASRRESTNMLSHEDDKDPIKHTKGSLGCWQCWPFTKRAWVLQKSPQWPYCTPSPNSLPWRLKHKPSNAQQEGDHKSIDWLKLYVNVIKVGGGAGVMEKMLHNRRGKQWKWRCRREAKDHETGKQFTCIFAV